MSLFALRRDDLLNTSSTGLDTNTHLLSVCLHCVIWKSRGFCTNVTFITKIAQKVTWKQLVFMFIKFSIYIVLSNETLKVLYFIFWTYLNPAYISHLHTCICFSRLGYAVRSDYIEKMKTEIIVFYSIKGTRTYLSSKK